MKNNIVVLLSTYNGEKYLQDQVESLLGQRNSNFDLFIRDDGSTDSTAIMLEKYRSHAKIHIECGENMGFAQSFLRMLKDVVFKYDYIMFSDQDDVWEEEKVAAFATYMDKVDQSSPVLYFCGYEVVNHSLEHIGFSKNPRVIGFESALVQNIVTGCTCGMNSAAARMIVGKLPNPEIKLHDWWAYLVVSSFGKVYFDNSVMIKYRQHEGNAIGAKYGFLNTLKKRLQNRLSGNKTMDSLVSQAELFMKMYEKDMNKELFLKIQSFIAMRNSIVERMKWATCPRPLRQEFVGDLFLRMAFLFWL